MNKLPRLIHIHLPGVLWKSITNDNAAKILPNFIDLIESGMSGPLPYVGPDPVMDSIVLTGVHPEINGLLATKDQRQDGFGVDIASIFHLKSPVLSQYLDDLGVNCASVNMKASQFLDLENGLVVSDVFNEIRTKHYEGWGIPPGSISPVSASEELGDFRIHPEELLKEQIGFFLLDNTFNPTEESIKIVAKVLAENSSVHAISTYLLDIARHQMVSVSYPAMSIINKHFPNTENTDVDRGIAWKFLRFLDSFLARIKSLMAIEDTIFISGGSESSPFWIAKGPGFLSDQLFPTDTTLYDFVPTALAHFGFENTELPGVIRSSKIAKSTRRGRPIPVDKFPPIDEIISSISHDIHNELNLSSEQEVAVKRSRFRKFFNLGEVYRSENKLAEAISEYKKALNLLEDDLALLRLCEVSLACGQIDQAELYYKRCKESDLCNINLSVVDAYILLAKENFIAASRMAIQARLSMKNPEKEPKFLIELNTKLEKILFDKNRLVLAKKHQDEIKILKAMNSSVPA